LVLYYTSERFGTAWNLDIWMTTRSTLSDDWTEAVKFGRNINTTDWDFGPHVLPGGRVMLFSSGRPGGVGGHDHWITRRATPSEPWGVPENLGPAINSPADDRCPFLAADGPVYFHSDRQGLPESFALWRVPVMPLINGHGVDASSVVTPYGLQLYFASDREGGIGEVDLWMSTRPTKDDEWGEPFNLGEPLNSPTWDVRAALSPDGLEFYFCRGYGAEGDLWVATRASLDDPWGAPTNLGPAINDDTLDCGPCLMPDGLTLYFYSDRLGEPPGGDMWMTTRPTLADARGTPINLRAPLNTGTWDYWPHIAADGLALLFCSSREGGYGNEAVGMARRSSVSDP
jgi:hypothetical protein